MTRAELLALTKRLVGIPSHEDEREAGTVVASWLERETDAAVRVDDAGSVIARRPAASGSDSAGSDGDSNEAGSDVDDERLDEDSDGDSDVADAESLALVGHHDVVPPTEEQVDADGDYVIEERDGRLYGRGTADMKGSLAAAMLAFRDATPATELVLASFAGEEQGGVGAQAAIDDGFSPDRTIVTEGSTGYSADGVVDVAVAHKGRRASTLVAAGTAGHASRPTAADNAVYRACDAVDIVRGLEAPETAVLGIPLGGSVAVTEIEGGTAWNVIPERCTVTVDERTVPGERVDLAAVEAVDGVEWRIDQDLPPMACGDAAFADRVLAAATAVQPETPEHVAKPHATDAGWLDAAGTDCVVCGAAEPGEAHTATESVSVEALERCYLIYRRVAESARGQ